MLDWLPNLDAYKCKQSFKTALATTLAAIITLGLHMPHPFWAPAIVIMLLDDYTEGSLRKGITRTMSTILGASFAYFLGHFTLNSEIIYYLSIFIVVSIVIYGNLVSGTAWLNFGVTFLFLSMYMVLDPNGAFDMAIWRSSEILTGVFCSILIGMFVFPSNIVRDTKQDANKLIAGSQYIFQQIVAAISNNQPLSWKNDKENFKKLVQKLETYQGLLSKRGRKGRLSEVLANLVEQGWGWWRQCGQVYELINHEPQMKKAILPLLEAYTELLGQWVDCVTNNKPVAPSLSTLKTQIEETIHAMTEMVTDTRDQAHYTLIQTWLVITQSWLNDLENYTSNNTPTTSSSQSHNTLKQTLHIFYIKLASKKSLIPHCLSIGLGCCLVTYVWLLTGWPGGVCAGISALVVGADSSLVKINMKIRLRLIGSMIGSAVGLSVFIFFVHSTFILILAVFIGISIFAYLSQNGFSAMYINWMASMGFILTVVPDVVHDTSIVFPFERAFGLIMGLIVMAFVVNFFWPLNYKKQFAEVCENIKRKIAITWSMLATTNSDNFNMQNNKLDTIQKQLMLLVDEGSNIAKPNKLMKQWMPVTDVIITLPWVRNYMTTEALSYLNKQYPNQWQAYCQQTYEAVLSDSPEQLNKAKNLWDKWADELHAHKDSDNLISHCWLMLQANERFCGLLAKNNQLYSKEMQL